MRGGGLEQDVASSVQQSLARIARDDEQSTWKFSAASIDSYEKLRTKSLSFSKLKKSMISGARSSS